MEDQKDTSIQELASVYLAAFKRYAGLAVAPALVVLLLIACVAFRLPDQYTADTTIFVQPPRLTSKIVAQPTKEEQQERIEALIQTVLSRPRLIEIIQRYSLYPGVTSGGANPEKALEVLFNAVKVEPLTSHTGYKLTQTFRLSFTYVNPKTAYDVTNALSDLFFQESLLDKRSEIKGTEEFLDSQLDKARRELERMEDQVQSFVRENFGRLPEHLDQAVARLEAMQTQLATNSAALSANSARRENLQRELAELRRSTSGAGIAMQGDDSSRGPNTLAELEGALAALQSRYSDLHPDVIRTQRRISALRRKMESADASGANKPFVGSSPAERELVRQINDVAVEIKAGQDEARRLKELIAELESEIQSMPVKEQELLKIRRDYDNVKAAYERLRSEKEQASLRHDLVLSQRDTQFKKLEPPRVPSTPSGPPRLLFSAGGICAALALFLVLPVGLYVLNPAYKSADELQEDLGLGVLGVIPPLNTRYSIGLKRRAHLVTWSLSSLVLFLGAVIIVIRL